MRALTHHQDVKCIPDVLRRGYTGPLSMDRDTHMPWSGRGLVVDHLMRYGRNPYIQLVSMGLKR